MNLKRHFYCAASAVIVSFTSPFTSNSFAQSHVYLECTLPDGKISRGSGVVVGSRGHILTARHVAPSGSKCKGVIGNVANTPVRPLIRRTISATYDALLMQFIPENGEVFNFVYATRLRDAHKEKKIVARGFPDGGTGELSARDGILSTIIPDEAGILQTTALSAEGMSGGPVVLQDNQELVGIIAGAEFSPITAVPKYYGVLAAELLIREFELREVGQPWLSAPSSTPGASVAGSVKVETRGAGQGAPQNSNDEANISETAATRRTGSESSQCDSGSGRTISSAEARGTVDISSGTSLRFSYLSYAQGGHYRTAATCIGRTLVGIIPHDTSATSRVFLNGIISFTPGKDDPIELSWVNLPPGSRVSTSDRDLQDLISGTTFSGNGNIIAGSLKANTRYSININLDIQSNSEGSCCPQRLEGHAFFTVKGKDPGIFQAGNR